MSFDVTADAYGRFMGRFSEPLAVRFVEQARVRRGQRALDVGCGPGALTAQLVERLGTEAVSAVDPSAPFVAAARDRFPGVDVRSGAAEQLPYPDDSFDLALAQLVVHFMADPVAGLREMARVTRPGGLVAACVWDHAGGGGPLASFWQAVHDLDPQAAGESGLAGAREGHLTELCESGRADRRRGVVADDPGAVRDRSTTGGSRSRWASVRPARTSRRWTTTGASCCAAGAPRCCRRRRSRSPHRPGRVTAAPGR